MFWADVIWTAEFASQQWIYDMTPYMEELRDAVGQAKSRPLSPVYPQISQAIYENVSAALEGSVTPAQPLEDAQADIEKALQTF